jgi:hypothetical protein
MNGDVKLTPALRHTNKLLARRKEADWALERAESEFAH